jgi:polyphosphate kinase
MDSPDFKAPQNYINRELSFLEFNQRVLDQAFDESVPLLERLRFLCISSSNLDEFFEIRVAGLKQLLELGAAQFASDALTPAELLAALHERALNLVSEQYRCLNEVLLPAMAAAGHQPPGPRGLDAGSGANGSSSISSGKSSRC